MNSVAKRNATWAFAAFLTVVASFAYAAAQAPPDVSDVEAQAHLLKHVDPVYPAIARVAQVQGQVALQIGIDPQGHVTTVKAISGPPMLIQAATDAVKQWQYVPFEQNGLPTTVSAKVAIPFSLGVAPDPGDEETARIYFPLSMKCVQLVSQRADPGEQAGACFKAAEQADRFSKNSRYIERRSSYVYYATALIRDKRPKEAIAAGEKAIAVVLQGHDDGEGSSAAYSVTGQAMAQSGDLAGADK